MSRKLNYKTKWREEIERFFQEVAKDHVTAADVFEYFRENGYTIGMTTVYRQLDNLVSGGTLNKYTIEAGSPACYEYAGHGADVQGCTCFHCKCEICGRLIHLHCDELKMIQSHLSEHHNFTLNPLRTVFYGVCDACRYPLSREEKE